jgi:predicted lipid-binding transport protein (Tim44 family)
LGDEDFKELGLSSLQSKKVMRGIEISTSQSEQGGAGDDSERIKELEAEIVELRAQLEENKKVAAPPPVTAPAPRHDAPPVRAAPPESNEHHVLRGAAGGALRGVIIGAVAGAVAGDAKKGAKIGAATGGAVGGVRGVGRSRRGRMAGKF